MLGGMFCKAGIVAVSVLVAHAAAMAAEPTTQPGQADVAALLDRVAALEARVAELENVADDEDDADALNVQPGFGGPNRRADAGKLKAIDLPQNPTRAQAKAFVDEIFDVSRRQNVFSSDDPQIDLLARVGRDHLDVLFEAAEDGDGFGSGRDMYLPLAIKRLVGPGDADRVIAALPQMPALAGIVAENGWAVQAKPQLLELLGEGDGAAEHGLLGRLLGLHGHAHGSYLDDSVYSAIIATNDADFVPPLIERVRAGQQSSEAYAAAEALGAKGEPLEAAVREAWDRLQENQLDNWERDRFAIIAAGHGHRSALEALVQQARDGDAWNRDRATTALRELVTVRPLGAPDFEWLDDATRVLVFDKATRRWSAPSRTDF